MMKKLFCQVLALILALCAGCAAAEEITLCDLWIELTRSVPEHTSVKQHSSTNNGRYIEGAWIGEAANCMMENMDIPQGGSTEDLLQAFLYNTYHPEQPFLEILVDDIEHVDAEIEEGEFYSFYDGREEISIAEFYLVSVELETPYGVEPYGVFFCVSMDRYGELAAEYIVSFGDLGALGDVRGVATKNYMGDMVVINCEEWVSLRATPSKSSERMAKVPLGALVKNGMIAENGFVMCEYDGMSGFILEEYLDLATW